MLFSAGMGIGLLYSGGLEALQTMTVIMALPFSILMVIMTFCLLRGLWVDDSYFSQNLSKSTAYWDGKHWRARLKKVVSTGKLEDVRSFLRDVVDPAFAELQAEFAKNRIATQICSGEEQGQPYRELIVESGRLRDFLYGVGCKEHDVSGMVVASHLLPKMDAAESFEPACYFADGRRGYSVKYMRRQELLTDVLRQYERYIRMITNSKHNLYLFDKKNEEA